MPAIGKVRTKKGRQQVGEDFQHGEKANPLRDEQLHQPEQLFGEHDETERRQADAERREKLTKDIAIEDGVQHNRSGRNPT